MASTGKKKTTMAKLTRESRLRERRLDKEARKLARKNAATHPPSQPDDPQLGGPGAGDPAPDQTLS
jgi:hypothetical protein